MNALMAAVVAALCLWFTILVVRQWLDKRSLSFAFWGASLCLAVLGSAAYAVCISTAPHLAWSFYVYYACGALWMPSIMGLGSVALIWSRRVVWLFAWPVFALGVFGSVFLLTSPFAQDAMAHMSGAGTGVIEQRALWLVPLIVLNSFGAAAVVGVAFVSIWKRVKRQVPSRFVAGNAWLAAGILVIFAAGSAARLGAPGLFWVVMLLGWMITFAGYRLLTPVTNQSWKVSTLH